ncbi:uncharacterized protein PAC_07386 [Phialocephala subalpina]|uniref:2EXR domain-containing protein n=1 Tax=Phialocephala subalpina TaxID=576137 RepID=A0A1L7WXK0_9HELO|nr:uncharacterized protein PAC_07386 [Phialocephala subalpina]
MSEEATPSMAFTLFNKLPPEVRCQVWQLSMPEPRIVPMRYDAETTSYKPRTRPPAILQTNHESRHEALKVYHEIQLGLSTNIGCYIDPLRDSIYLRTDLTRASNRIDDSTDIEPWQRGRVITMPPPVTDASPTSTQSTQTDQAATSDPSDIEVLNSTAPHPDMLRSRRHSKIILHDLIHSSDAEAIFRSFYVNYGTWDLMRRYYRHRRHKLHVSLKELCLVYESGSAPLKSGLEMREIGPQEFVAEGDPSRPADYDARRQAYRMVCSLKASNSFVNSRDRKQGKPVALTYQICAKSLDTGELPRVQEISTETGWLTRCGVDLPPI